MVGHDRRLGPARRFLPQAQLREEHTDVHHPAAEVPRPGLVGRPAQDQRVLMHRRAAARRVREDGIHVDRERIEVAPRRRLRRGEVAGVPREAAAAALGARHVDFHAVAREHVDRRRVDVGLQHLLRATRQQRHPRAPLPARRRNLGQSHRRRHLSRREVEHRTQRPGHESSKGPAHRGPLEGPAKARRIRNGHARHPTAETLRGRARSFRVEPRAERADQVAVGHATRAGRLAREATEAAVDVRLRRLQREAPLEHLLHQHDATAGGIHLLPEFLIGGTRREAEPAVHAGLYRLRHRFAQRSVFVRLDRVQHRQSSSAGNLPAGSSTAFTAAATALVRRGPGQSGPSPRSSTPDQG